MRTDTFVRASALALVVAGTSILAAPQQTTTQAGQMTKPSVWVENRGHSEAVPVDLRDVNLDAPLRIQVMNGDPSAPRLNPVLVTEVRKTWEYMTVTIGPKDDVVTLMNARGSVGWEATGIAFVTADTTKLLLKRPR